MGLQLWHRFNAVLIGLSLVTMAVCTPMSASAQAYLDSFGNIQQRPTAPVNNPAQLPNVIYAPVVPTVIQGYNYAFPAYAAPVVIRRNQPSLAPIQTVPANPNQCIGVSCPPVRY